MRKLVIAAAAAWVATSGARPHAQTRMRAETLWVTLGDIDQLVEVDPDTLKEVRRIKTDPKPHGLAASPDGRRVYVASDRTGNFQVVDVDQGKVVAETHVGDDPNQMALTLDGKIAFQPLRGEDQVAVVQLDPLKVVKKVPTPGRPHDAYRTPDGNRIYMGSLKGNAISEIEPEGRRIVRNIQLPDGVRPMEISKDSKTIYAAISNMIGFVVVDLATGTVTRTVELAKKDPGVPQPYLDTYTHSLQMTADGRELWVTDCVNDVVRVVSLATMKETLQIPVGHFPHWFAMTRDGKTIFVSDWYSDAVTAIDVALHRVRGNIQFERASGPKRIAIAPKPPARSTAQ